MKTRFCNLTVDGIIWTSVISYGPKVLLRFNDRYVEIESMGTMLDFVPNYNDNELLRGLKIFQGEA